ncbi:MAG: PqqD family protein [Gemmatimonadota bacterium]
MLSSRPTRNELLKWEKNEAGEARITVVRQDNWKIRLLSRLFYIPRERTITLDEVGTEVWQMCTGHTSVAQMIEGLRGKYQLDRKEAEVSLLSYLKTLGQKRFVGFVLEGEGERRGRRHGGRKAKKG